VSAVIEQLGLTGLAVAAVLYWRGLRRSRGGRERRERRRRAQAFYAGLIAVAVAVEQPLDSYSDKLFWAHMVQHMLLQMVAPPLIVLGAPWLPLWRPFPLRFRRRVSRWLLHSRSALPLRRAARVLASAPVALLLFFGTIAVSHLPVVFDFALRDSTFHEIEHMLFLTLGVLFWSRVIDSPPFHAHLTQLRRLAFLLAAAAAETLLALVILAAHSPLYAPYRTLLPRPEHLSPLEDQQLGGAIMLEPASISLLLALAWSIGLWHGASDGKREEAGAVQP
jgi:cytochrome c oxidase assembly factor CtaG